MKKLSECVCSFFRGMFRYSFMDLVFGISIVFFVAGVNSVENESEAKLNAKSGHHADHQDEYNNESRIHLHKRQVNSRLPQPLPPQQDFPSPFISNQPDSDGPIRPFFGQLSADEEERFFLLQGQQETTLNPLAFDNPPRTTTPSPSEQQFVDQQRRFQEEIANKGLREQQQRSFGVPQPPTTRPTTTTTTSAPNPFDPDPFAFQGDSFANAESPVDFEQSTENVPFNVINTPQSHSYSYSRIFRSVNRRSRSVDRPPLSVNLLTPSTSAPQPTFFHDIRTQSTSTPELGPLGNWLVANLNQLQHNIANLAESTVSPYTQRSVKPQSYYITPKSQSYYSTSKPQSYYSTTPTHNPYTNRPFAHTETNQHSTTALPSKRPVYYSTEAPRRPTAPHFTYARDEAKEHLDYTRVKELLNHVSTSTKEPLVQQNLPAQFHILPQPSVLPETSLQNDISTNVDIRPAHNGVLPNSLVDYKPIPVALNVQNSHFPSHTHQADVTYEVSSTSSRPIDVTRLPKVKNVQILSSSPAPTELSNFPPRPNNAASFLAFKQIFAVDPRRVVATEPPTVAPSALASTENSTSITQLFKAKLNELKSLEAAQPTSSAVEEAQSNFRQPNRFLEQLQLQQPMVYGTRPEGDSDLADVSVDQSNGLSEPGVANGSAHHSPKTAIFIRVPAEEPSSTIGYLFDQPITAKSFQKKENHSNHKKNYRSAQVIKSSLVYRTPPGKRATVSRQELSENNLVDAGAISNLADAGTPIKWLRGNAATPATTNRPFVNALLNFIQKRSPQ